MNYKLVLIKKTKLGSQLIMATPQAGQNLNVLSYTRHQTPWQ